MKALFLLSCLLITLQFSFSYNPEEGLEYAYAAALSHCPPATIYSWTCGQACKNLTGYQPLFAKTFNLSFAHTFEAAIIVKPSAKKVVTVYRSTIGSYQFLLEVLGAGSVPYTLTDVPGAEVDRYFYNHYVKDLRPTMAAQIREAKTKYPDYHFVFVGHSLGAALTTLTAFDAVTSGLVPSAKSSLFTFGSPRVGNYQLIEAIEKAIPIIYRITHYKDIVPHVPPCFRDKEGNCTPNKTRGAAPPLSWPAYHLKTEVYYNEDHSQYIVCKENEDRQCSDQFPLIKCRTVDHDIYMNVPMKCPLEDKLFENKGKPFYVGGFRSKVSQNLFN